MKMIEKMKQRPALTAMMIAFGAIVLWLAANGLLFPYGPM